MTHVKREGPGYRDNALKKKIHVTQWMKEISLELILVLVHTSVPFLILPPFPFIC